jgi:hypothetical protein
MSKFYFLMIGIIALPFLPGLRNSKQNTIPSYEKERFTDHGVAAPFANDRGIVATVDGKGRNVVLLWLFDRRGGYGLLMIDAATGASEQFPMPFKTKGECPYSSLFSSRSKLYTLFDGNFVEFDPKKRAFTFHHKTAPGMAMGMTEDDQGRVWAVTYPNSGLVCYDPKTRQLTDYGYVHKENWQQYQRYMATDNHGWVYFAIGNTSSQIIAFNPHTHETKPLLQPSERQRGTAYVYRDKNGKVYGQALKGSKSDWYELYLGTIKKIGNNHQVNEKKILTGSQALRLLNFPNGERVKSIDLINRKLTIKKLPGQGLQTVNFDYTTQGTWVMGVAASPDRQSIIGGSSFPMRLLKYTVDKDSWNHKAAYGQYNTLTTQGKYVFFGSYPGGNLVVWDTEKPYTGTRTGDANENPRILVHCSPVIHRPHRVIVCPDGNTIIMGGGPDYGYTGGGLVFYDMKTQKHVLLTDRDIVANQSTMSLTVLNDGKILGGTTTAPGTGGEKKAHLAKLYIIDKETKTVDWKGAVIPGVQTYTDLITRQDGKVYGIADRRIFFVFDPNTKRVIYQKDVTSEFGYSVAGQCPRVFIRGDGDDLYVLFVDAIAKIDNQSYHLILLDHPPQPVRAGGAYLNKSIYYISGSSLFSYRL